MSLIFLVIVLIAIGFVFWDSSIRGKQGRALALSVMAVGLVSLAGIAQGADVSAPWPLIALILGAVVFVVSEREGDTTRRRRE